MKKTTLALTLSTIITLSSNAQALELLVVNNYDNAGNAEIWKKAKTDQVPEALLGTVSMHAPGAAYSAVFPKTFMQEQLFAVCHHDCNDKEIFRVKNGEITDKDNWDVIEQSNVYYWLSKYFSFADQDLNFRLDQHLRVMTDREVRENGKILRNNAFFNPRDITLSFLPASKNLLFKLMGGKINRSGFDPSVIAHETSHYLFHHLFPNPINEEISGLNEGFADYVANAFLSNPRVGQVMLQGKTLRDSSAPTTSAGKFKTYEKGMESHDLGELVAYALWSAREAAHSKTEMDQAVIDAVIELSQNPYATVHDFKNKMLARLDVILPGDKVSSIKSLFEIIFPGEATKVANLNFLNQPVKAKSFLGFSTKQIIPEEMAKQFGIPSVDESSFSIINMVNVAEGQIAILMASEDSHLTTPYWIVFDTNRGNVLGVYGLDKKLVTNEEEVIKVKALADKAVGSAEFIKDFTGKLKTFTELSQGKGELAIAYKVKDQTTANETVIFNGTPVSGRRIHTELKRKLLAGVLLGLPEINGIDLVTIPLQVTALPEVNGQKVIGFRLSLKDGTQTEILLNKYSL